MNGSQAVDLRAVEPGPDITNEQADCACYAEGITVEICFGTDQPVVFHPVRHAVCHGNGGIPDAWGNTLGCMRQPVTDPQGYFGQDIPIWQEDSLDQGGVLRFIRSQLSLQSPTETM